MDQRNVILAKNLTNYSTRLKKGEKVLIECRGLDAIPLTNQIVKEAYALGAIPFVWTSNDTTKREILLGLTQDQCEIMAEVDSLLMSKMDAYIGISCQNNSNEFSDIPTSNHNLFNKFYSKPVHIDRRVADTKWVVLRYPTFAMAQENNMSYEAFLEYYYNVCNLDYKKMSIAMDSLIKIMEKTDKVKIVGPGTNLEFSIKGIPSIKCDGLCNIPDGEVYTAPVKDSVNGFITYNTPATYQGFVFENIRLEFKNGKIISSTSNDSERITSIFDTDDGARFVGEFAIGVNPYITKACKDTLFDEKIAGSFHFTPGSSYNNAFNGNKSAIHWDLVCIQTPEYGGGQMYFDDVLIRNDGLFVIDELKCLNPENLK